MKSNAKKLTIIIIVLLLTCLCLSISACSKKDVEEEEKKNIINTLPFFTSFEDNDELLLLQSEPDGAYNLNVEKTEYLGVDPDNFSTYVIYPSIQGDADYFAGEGKINLFDNNSNTKYLVNKAVSIVNPMWVSFKLRISTIIKSYEIVSANDYPERDPKRWTLYGSNDGTNWTSIDTQTNQSFSGRYTANTYNCQDNNEAFYYYKISVFANNGATENLTQIADINLRGIKNSSIEQEIEGDSPLSTVISHGPTSVWTGMPNVGWTGYNALRVSGKQTANTTSYARNIIYNNLDIPVTEYTKISYHIFPALYESSVYDYNYTSMFMSVDLKFNDGTYLSELGVVDQNGFLLDPLSQGYSNALYTMQWNYIEAYIGQAIGKRINQILIYYKMD